ncbi:MAG: hypothetical protein ACLU3I_02870 [Acutalibacteraceae bacterium]
MAKKVAILNFFFVCGDRFGQRRRVSGSGGSDFSWRFHSNLARRVDIRGMMEQLCSDMPGGRPPAQA